MKNITVCACFRYVPALLVLAILCVSSKAESQGLGDLLVTPTRVTFEGAKRFEVLTLVNRAADSATYEISVVQYRMTPEGKLEEIAAPDSGQMFATDLVRFFPRRVMLGPKEVQNVRVQLKKPEGLAEGEYRSHLYFRAVPKEQRLDDELQDSAAAQKEFAIKLTPIYGVTVPVIVRNGELNSTVAINDLKLIDSTEDKNDRTLSMTFVRNGSRSVYGDLRVKFVGADGEETPLTAVNGVAVYTPNRGRTLQVAVKAPEGKRLRNGRIVVEYISKSDLNGGLLASAELSL